MRRIEAKPQMSLQRRRIFADSIELRDFRNNISWRVVSADADFVFFRVEIFFASGQWRGFTELEARIHPPQARKRRRQRGADQKSGPARGLQEIWVDVGSIDEKMRTKELLCFRRRQLNEIVD